MSRIGTAEELRKQHIEKLGEELGPVFHALYNEVAWIYIKWNEYVELFGKKSSRMELINGAAPMFFRIVQDLLLTDTLIHITRLTDPPKSAGKPNLTIQRLPHLLIDDNLKENVGKFVDLAVQRAEFCRDWRNRLIAHKDLKLALKEEAEPLIHANREKVSAALDSISVVMNAVSSHYMAQTITFEGIPSPHGAVALLYVIDDGLKVQKERRDQRSSGQYPPADHRPRDL